MCKHIYDLASLCKTLGYQIYIYQHSKNASKESSITIEGIKVIEIPLTSSFQTSYNNIRKNNPDAYIIISTDQMNIRDTNYKTLQIQHGIAFDIPAEYIKGIWGKSKYLMYIRKFLSCVKNVKRFNQVPNTICVDYNFYNWFRTLGIINKRNYVKVIPNYASNVISKETFAKKLIKDRKVKKIIFARRFVDYRGTILFADVAEKLLKDYKEIQITFAGSGPLEEYLKNRFSHHDRVEITSFSARDSVKFQTNYDIAVIPTIFSEGTSLSLIEALAAGCFTIATHVGGITNIIIDGYNGVLSYPNFDSLFSSLVRVIEMPSEEFESIIGNGYNTVTKGLNLANWQSKWTEVLQGWTKDRQV